MMNRRQLVCSAGAALIAGTTKARAASYDLLIKGGRVIDPSAGLDAVRDVAIGGVALIVGGMAMAGAGVGGRILRRGRSGQRSYENDRGGAEQS